MTNESTWRRVCVGAKLGLGAAVVAGVMAFSATAHAVTTTLEGNHQFGGTDITFNTNAVDTNTISVGDYWIIDINANNEAPTGGLATEHYARFDAQESLIALTVSNTLPPAGFEDLEIGWFDSFDGAVFSGGTWESLVGPEFELNTSIAAFSTKYLAYRWTGLTGSVASLNTHVNAIPLPAGLVLFLSGLAGIGFLGRYKAKRREPAVA